MSKSNKAKQTKQIINNALMLQADIELTQTNDGEGQGVAEQKKRIVEVTKELRQMFKAKESCHYARYIRKHHYNVIDAVNEAIDNFKRSDDVLANKEYFAKAIEAKTKLSADTFQSTAYDVLCEFEKFINAKTENEEAIVADTHSLLKEGVACALMTTQKQTFNHLLNAEAIEAEKQAKADEAKADADTLEAQSLSD